MCLSACKTVGFAFQGVNSVAFFWISNSWNVAVELLKVKPNKSPVAFVCIKHLKISSSSVHEVPTVAPVSSLTVAITYLLILLCASASLLDFPWLHLLPSSLFISQLPTQHFVMKSWKLIFSHKLEAYIILCLVWAHSSPIVCFKYKV